MATKEIVRLQQIEPARCCPKCEGRVHRGSSRVDIDGGRLYRIVEECVHAECGWRRALDNVKV